MKSSNDKDKMGNSSTDMDSFPSDLVTGNKLLTREEECTLKTALAFVVIKARARARSRAVNLVGEATDESQDSIGHRTPPFSKADHSSILDHLFCNDNNKKSSTEERRSLDCNGDRKHVEYMFRAAKTLAETWLSAQTRAGRELERASLSLQGATRHLAHQLQLWLVSNTNDRNEDRHTQKRRRRRSSLSINDSISTPSSFRRTNSADAPSAVLVTPASQSQSTTTDDNSNSHETNNGMDDTIVIVQDWIRSTLLGHNVEMEDSRMILSDQNASLLDIRSSFHVYAVMVPQIAGISPPLIGHIFQIAARLVMDLYSDAIVMADEDSDPLLDCLATSALGLLELCWTTEITIGESREREGHRSFLLLSLQGILGELLVPLSREGLAYEHYRLTFLDESLQPDSEQEDSSDESTDSQDDRSSKRQRQPSNPRNLRTLDPEAKLLLRMAVYRLIVQKRKV